MLIILNQILNAMFDRQSPRVVTPRRLIASVLLALQAAYAGAPQRQGAPASIVETVSGAAP
jgi:hypothetical protein